MASHQAERSAPGRGELAAFERTGQVSVKARLQELVELSIHDRPTMRQLAERLEALGIGVRVTMAEGGQVAGISYELDGVAMRGSDLGRAYSWGGLQNRRGVTYDANRDLPVLQAISEASARETGRKARHAQPESAPMPKLDKPAQAYRDAAVLVSRIEAHERAQRLYEAQYQAGELCFRARQFLAERERTVRRLDTREQGIFAELGRAYEDPHAAGVRLRELIDTRGHERAAQTLGQDPGQLGRLHGAGVGSLRSATRGHAIAATSWMARELRDIDGERGQLAASAPQAAKAVADLESAQGHAQRLSRMSSHLPDPGRLDRDVLQAAQSLGMEAVKSLSTLALRIVTRLAEEKELARDFARESDLSPGR